MAAIDNDQAAAHDPVVDLQTLFRYQNNTTGAVSNATLTAQQICRLLCPPVVAQQQRLQPQIIHSDTNVLQQLPDGSYASWRTAKTVPVLRESCALWYKFSKETGVSPTPMTCRQVIDDDPNLLTTNSKVSTVRFSSECTNSEWKTLQQLPDLRKAMEALYIPPNKTTVAGVSTTDDAAETTGARANKSIQQELEAFLSATTDADGVLPPEEEGYESDGGTWYVKDTVSGRWIHEKLAQAKQRHVELVKVTQPQSSDDKLAMSQSNEAKKRKRKGRFSARKGRCWIYVTGLPLDCSESEVAERFQKAGILELDPETQKPKIKLYRHKKSGQQPNDDAETTLKGDASICFARLESVNLAITLFDGAPLRLQDKLPLMAVTAAKFEQRGSEFDPKRNHVSEAKRKVAKLAALQAMDWDEGEFNGRLTGGRKGLRIIVLKGMFDAIELGKLSESDEEEALHKLEHDLRGKCEEWGAAIEKMTVFSKNKDGVVVLKFAQPGAASEVVKQMNGRSLLHGRSVVEASFWDGKTDYTVVDEEAVAKDVEERLEAFGNWLESQHLPEELRLQSE